MKRKKNENILFRPELYIGLLFLVLGLDSIITGNPIKRQYIPAPSWAGWIVAPFGVWILYMTFKARWRNKQEDKREAEAAALEEKDCETQVDVASGTDESESKKDEPPQGGA